MPLSESLKSTPQKYLTFVLAGEEYGVDVLAVQELRCWEKTTPIFGVPPFVLGVINLRGLVVPIVDLRACFGLPHQICDLRTVVMMINVEVQGEHRMMGMVVDAVSEVYDMHNHQVHPAPKISGAVANSFITGLVSMGQKMVVLLDVYKFIHEGVLSVNSELKQSLDSEVVC